MLLASPDLSGLLTFAAIPIFLGIAALIIVAQSQRGVSMLDAWAKDNNLTILRADRCYLWPGPFLFRTNRGTVVYRITARDAEGHHRTGYARCGSYWLGMWFSNSVTVEWDRDSLVRARRQTRRPKGPPAARSSITSGAPAETPPAQPSRPQPRSPAQAPS